MTGHYKRLKDPIYGYVQIPEYLFETIIDTAEFQRLRDVIQTSYSPLYASAVHNRFVHSIGVYYLGTLVADTLLSKVPELFENIEEYIDIFKVACLLHDVGHAPFSHTGEGFYLEDGNRDKLHNAIAELTDDDVLLNEIRDNSYKAAPHELMSVIVGLKSFSAIIPSDKRSFFARCILGYKYVENMDGTKQLLNCLIEMLNSKIIDVDKMDYLIRDAYSGGFETVKIDYQRFLQSVRVECDEDGLYKICFEKAALSVIENIVYAHDNEKKWIQNHPTVLYEWNLLKTIFEQIVEKLEAPCISEEFLTIEGKDTKEYGHICLFSDSDIKHIMKQNLDNDSVHQYFFRKDRWHPLWKSEAEFQALFQNMNDELSMIDREIKELQSYLRTLGMPFILNKTTKELIQKDIDECREKIGKELAGSKEYVRMQISIKEKNRHLDFIKIFEDFYEKSEDVSFNFLLIYADQFNSSFRKPEFSEIMVKLPEMNGLSKFGEISSVLQASKSIRDKYFYIYCQRNKEARKKESSVADLIGGLIDFGGNLWIEERVQEAKSRTK